MYERQRDENRALRVYFARAIDGLSIEDVAIPASLISELPAKFDVELLDPLVGEKTVDKYREVVDADLALLRTADVVLMDMSIPDRNYVGCCCELVYAHLWGIPVSVYIGQTNYDNRKWLWYHAAYIGRTWDTVIRHALSAAAETTNDERVR